MDNPPLQPPWPPRRSGSARSGRITLSSRTRRVSRARWGGYIVALALLGAGAVVYLHLTDAERIRRLAEAYLDGLVNTDVQVRAAEFSFFRGTQLIGVTVLDPGDWIGGHHPSPSESPIAFHCPDLLLKHDPIQMLLGRLKVTEVVAVRPSCLVIQDAETGRLNLQGLFATGSRAGPNRAVSPPIVRLRDASLRLLRRTAGKTEPLETFQMQMLAQPDPADPMMYRVAWSGGGRYRSSGRTLVDLRSVTVVDEHGGLPWISLDTAMLTIASRLPEALPYVDLFGLSGEVRVRGYSISANGPTRPQRRGTIELRQGHLSVPIDDVELDLPADQRYLRFTDVEGSIEVIGERLTATLHGLFHGSPVEATAEFQGQPQAAGLADVGFDITFAGTDLTLPSKHPEESEPQARFVRRWKKLRDMYRDYDPHGRASISLAITKAPGKDEPVQVKYGRLEGINCDAAYRFFPYRVANLSGVVEFTSDGVFLRDLRGTHAGAPIVVNGKVSEPRWHAAVDLHITGSGVPLDADLHDALNPIYQRIWDQFALAGTADIAVEMKRDLGVPGQTKPWNTRIEADLRNSQACFDGFPYPVDNVRGRVSVTPSNIRVIGLTGTTGTGTVVASGSADLETGQLTDLNLTLEAMGIPIDDPLISALPPDARKLVESLSPRGSFSLAGMLTYDAVEQEIQYDLHTAIRDGTATYKALPVPVDQLRGTMRLRPRRIDVEELTGRHGECTIRVTGYHIAEPNNPSTRLSVLCRNLQVDDSVKAQLPEETAKILADLTIDGRLTTETIYEQTTVNGEPVSSHRTEITLNNVGVTFARFPVPLTDVCGRIIVSSDGLEIPQLSAAHHDTRLDVSATCSWADGTIAGRGRAAATHVGFSEELRQAVPWRWRKAWNDIQPEGTFDVDIPEITYRRVGDGPGRWFIRGDATLHDVGATLGVRVSNATGRIGGECTINDAAPGVGFAGTLALDRLAILDRQATDVVGRIDRSAEQDALRLTGLQGRMYGGRVTGAVHRGRGDDSTTYDATALLHEVDLREFVNAGRPEDNDPIPMDGMLEGRLYISGTTGRPETRRGGGLVHVSRGRLFAVPLLASILNVINYGDLDERAFHGLSGEFFLQANHIQIKDLMLTGHSLSMMGSGTLRLPDKKLDLTLISATPRKWGRLPVLTDLLEGTGRELMEVRVYGPIDNTAVKARPFQGVVRTLEPLVHPKPVPMSPTPSEAPPR